MSAKCGRIKVEVKKREEMGKMKETTHTKELIIQLIYEMDSGMEITPFTVEFFEKLTKYMLREMREQIKSPVKNG